MRLIDTNEIKHWICSRIDSNESLGNEERAKELRIVLSEIDSKISIVYDVDKVVQKLESEIQLKVTQYPIHGTYIKKSRAIEIVKAGGVNE